MVRGALGGSEIIKGSKVPIFAIHLRAMAAGFAPNILQIVAGLKELNYLFVHYYLIV